VSSPHFFVPSAFFFRKMGSAKSQFNVSLWPKRSSSGLKHQRARLPLEATDPLVGVCTTEAYRIP